MIIPLDQPERETALLPRQSFIVQAPAGSGKTEVLIQRFLNLLSTVNQPEEVLAITFTRKAAVEMRERLFNALEGGGKSPLTQQLAEKVLKTSLLKEWKLLENPARLRILTIDALCAYLTQQMPILSCFGGQPSVTDRPEDLYVLAARELLTLLETEEPWAISLRKLLLHLDNNFMAAENLLVAMLSHREQWLPHIMEVKYKSDLRKRLEKNLQRIIRENIKKCEEAFPLMHKKECKEILSFAIANREKIHENSSEEALSKGKALKDTEKEWKEISHLLLTKECQWRKKIDKTLGFPATEKIMKKRMTELLEDLSSHEALRQCLEDFLQSPAEIYTESQWEILEALIELLPLLVAQLRVIFQQQGKVDFNEIAQAALHALGNPELPTNLALKLDYQIQHILVDEFQDTSRMQFLLLEALTAGWQAGDGKTMFLVGDPMQSIYRFRQAEVGLFLKAKKEGLSQVVLKPLALKINFRSQSSLVEWLNRTFSQIFPKNEEIEKGAVSFTPCNAIKEVEEKVPVHWYLNEVNSAEQIVSLIQTLQNQGSQEKIAILVRSRTHLKEIIPALKKAGLKFKGVEIDKLLDYSVIQDLWALTRALLHPADRIAWLAILRSPWCGLTLSDLHLLAQQDLECPLGQITENPDIVQKLTADGQARLRHCLDILSQGIKGLQTNTLRDVIVNTWMSLHGPACVTHEIELIYAKSYFKLLEELPQEMVNEIDWLEKRLKNHFAPEDPTAEDYLQIMTIHKAKGLEFDHVILPYLEKKPLAEDNRLLLWLERFYEGSQTDLILAPIKSLMSEESLIYDYVRTQDKKKHTYEIARLLYVACTRAKKTLHLFGRIEKDENDQWKSPPSQSFLELLFPCFLGEKHLKEETELIQESFQTKSEKMLSEVYDIPLKRLKNSYFNGIQQSFTLSPKAQKKNFTSMYAVERVSAQIVGTVIHRALENLSHFNKNHSEQNKKEYLESQPKFWKRHLLQLGLPSYLLDEKLQVIEHIFSRILEDKRGQWILHPHRDAKSEYPVTLLKDKKSIHLIIDRVFKDEEGIQWVIDYKTSVPYHNEIPLEVFLEQQKNLYHPQLTLYAEALQKLGAMLPIKCGLYFPLFAGWKSWDYM